MHLFPYCWKHSRMVQATFYVLFPDIMLLTGRAFCLQVYKGTLKPLYITLDLNSVQASLACPASQSRMGLTGSTGNPPSSSCSSVSFFGAVSLSETASPTLTRHKLSMRRLTQWHWLILSKGCSSPPCWCKYRAI